MNKRILKPKYIVGFIVISIAIPILVNLLYFSWGTSITFVDSKSWLGFFGSYIGSIIGGLLTLIGVIITINEQNEGNEKEQIQKTRRLLSLLIEEADINHSLLQKMDKLFNTEDEDEAALLLDESAFLENFIWKQMKSEALLLLDTEIVRKLVEQYELVSKYNRSTKKVQGEYKKIKLVFQENKDSLENLLQESLRR
ncbi:hypothetical protein [Priestia aryabhattai]|uniref:hypothetical protein n=1 Tax=Priestia aryabhattai TaxID=412384 RepID=UPI002E1A88BE|nr:hypothetical protein [Priestia aryabhattai]MED4261386.1 hypothetical protein [Priestia aryabhattai]